MKPLDGLLILDFSQFLAGPSAGLRLADLGARVIKVERPDGGDLCRQLYKSEFELDGDSTLFHSINRNKESMAANLKDPKDLAAVKVLIKKADVMIQNFRPGVIERLGLDYETVRALNPRLIYGQITGYGQVGPWRDKPGQDLLAQSLSGLPWLNGNADQPPSAFWSVGGGSDGRGSFGARYFSLSCPAWNHRGRRSGRGQLARVNLRFAVRGDNHFPK